MHRDDRRDLDRLYSSASRKVATCAESCRISFLGLTVADPEGFPWFPWKSPLADHSSMLHTAV